MLRSICKKITHLILFYRNYNFRWIKTNQYSCPYKSVMENLNKYETQNHNKSMKIFQRTLKKYAQWSRTKVSKNTHEAIAYSTRKRMTESKRNKCKKSSVNRTNRTRTSRGFLMSHDFFRCSRRSAVGAILSIWRIRTGGIRFGTTRTPGGRIRRLGVFLFVLTYVDRVIAHRVQR